MACRLPGARSTAEFWEVLINGVDAIGEVPRQRASWANFHALPGETRQTPTDVDVAQLVRLGGWLSDVDFFDPTFFHISPRVAQSLDPQQRLLMEVAWETFEDLGAPPSTLCKSPTGVFIGASNNDYRTAVQQQDGEAGSLCRARGMRPACWRTDCHTSLTCRGRA